MACASCARARQRAMSQARQGNVGGTIKAVSHGAKLMAQKAAGIDIDKKYKKDGKTLYRRG